MFVSLLVIVTPCHLQTCLVVCLTKRPNCETTQQFTAKPCLQALRLVATVEELLDEVVAEGVHHELCKVV